jgi:diketogulonate reductase-like aldo/keto reductase
MRGLTVMAYSPIEQGRIPGNGVLKQIAARHHATPAQIALAWVVRQDGIVAIPRASSTAHLRENHGALGITLSPHDLDGIDRAFPPETAAAARNNLTKDLPGWVHGHDWD